MPRYTQRKMCRECPFRANAPAGWLGPATPQEVHDTIHGEGFYICHVSINKMIRQGIDEDEWLEEGQHCVGFLRYRSTVCKRGRDRAQSDRQTELQEIPDQSLIPPRQFKSYHERGPMARQKDEDDG